MFLVPRKQFRMVSRKSGRLCGKHATAVIKQRINVLRIRFIA